MNAQITQLRTLVMKELDPVYFNMDEQQISYWHAEILVLREFSYCGVNLQKVFFLREKEK